MRNIIKGKFGLLKCGSYIRKKNNIVLDLLILLVLVVIVWAFL